MCKRDEQMLPNDLTKLVKWSGNKASVVTFWEMYMSKLVQLRSSYVACVFRNGQHTPFVPFVCCLCQEG